MCTWHCACLSSLCVLGEFCHCPHFLDWSGGDRMELASASSTKVCLTQSPVAIARPSECMVPGLGPWGPGALVPRPAPAGTRVPTGPLPPCLGAWLSFLFPEAFYPSLNPHPDLALLPLFLGFLGLVGGRQTEATKI